MEIQHLKYFYMVAKLKSFTKAAQALFIGQPTVSKAIKNLERITDTVLFERDKKEVKLTADGLRFYQRCSCIFQEVEALQIENELFKKECVGELKIGVADSIGIYLLASYLQKFANKHPLVDFKIEMTTSSAIKRALIDHDLDFGLFFMPPREKELVVKIIKPVEFVIVCSPILANKNLDELRYIGTIGSDSSPLSPLLIHQKLGIRPKRYLKTSHQELQKRLVLSGLGYTIIPRYMVQDEIKQKKLLVVEYQQKPKALFLNIHLVYKRNKIISKGAKEFMIFLNE